MRCQDVREALATALLGDEPVASEVQAHVETCPECAAEAAELRAVVALLPYGDDDAGLERPIAPPDELFLQRLLDEAARRRTSRIRRIVIASLGAVAALVLVVGGVAAVANRMQPPVAEPVQAAATAGSVHATVSASPAGSGSALHVAIAGVKPGTRCLLRVASVSAAPEIAADWRAEYDGTAQVKGWVAAPPEQIRSVDVVDAADDHVLLRVPFA